mgnify:CR=1 FL=1
MAKFCGQCGKSVETGTDRESGRLLCAECGAVLGYSASALPRGTVIAGYRIEEPIGQGGMGVVYRAEQINLQRPAALKILSDELADEPGFVESFFHEARIAANLTHPNIVQAYAAGTTKEGINYFAMELVEGESLDVKLRRTGPLAPVPAVEVALQLAGALEYAWNTRKMCHGDIKPDNVLIYATSNRRHLIRETWTDRTDLENNNGMHKSDTMQEKLSLVNRFGVTINYSKPSQKEYFQIVVGLAEKNGIHMTEEELCAEANKWELSHGGISGRTAQQFINYLAGKQE